MKFTRNRTIVVTLKNPDDPMGMPAYEGPAGDAHHTVAPGEYRVTDTDFDGEDLILIVHPDDESWAICPIEVQ